MVQLIQRLDCSMYDYVLRILLRLQQRVSATPGHFFPGYACAHSACKTSANTSRVSRKKKTKKSPHRHSFSNAVAAMRCLLTRKAASLWSSSGGAATQPLKETLRSACVNMRGCAAACVCSGGKP